MEEKEFRAYLKKGGRSKNAIERVIAHTREFQTYLKEQRSDKGLPDVRLDDLEHFVNWIESEPKTSAKLHLWALWYYFDFIENEDLKRLASIMRGQRIKRKPFLLKEFRGVDPDVVAKLSALKVKNVSQMLKKGRTPQDREELAKQSGVPLEAILELVKLSDLARIPGVKGIRARLYVDAGVDTIEKLAQWEPVAFRDMIVEFVERTHFDGIATLPAEARFTIERARSLPRIVEYD